MSTVRLLRATCCLALAPLAVAVSAAPLYRAQPLELVTGNQACAPVAINARGIMIGKSTTKSGSVAWAAGRSGRLAGTRPLAGELLIGLDDRARIIADRPVEGVPYTYQAFSSGPGGRGGHAIDRLGWAYSYATGVASDGRVVGSVSGPGMAAHAFVTGPGGVGTIDLHDLVPGGGWDGDAVNTLGQVVAMNSSWYFYASGPRAQGFTPVRVPGDGPGDNVPTIVGINDAGLIAGHTYSEPGDMVSGWLVRADGTGLRRLEALPGGSSDFVEPLALNNAGVVVGAAMSSTGFGAFILRGPDAPMEELNDLVEPGAHGYLEWASAVNDAGQILVEDDGGACYRLDPIDGAQAAGAR